MYNFNRVSITKNHLKIKKQDLTVASLQTDRIISKYKHLFCFL